MFLHHLLPSLFGEVFLFPFLTTTALFSFAPQLGLSAIIGSGMIAFLLAPAICALGAKQILKLKRRPLAKNILFYDLSLFALCWFFKDGIVDIKEATFMLVIYAGYIVVSWQSGRCEEIAADHFWLILR